MRKPTKADADASIGGADASSTGIDELRRISETAAIGLTRCSRDLRFLSANRAYCELVGLPPAQVIGRPIGDVLGTQACESIRPYVERVLRGESVEYEMEMPFRSAERYVQVNYAPDIGSDGAVIGWVASVMDITERKRAENALRARARELETIMEMVPAVIFVADDPQCRTIRANRVGRELLNLPPGANASKSALDAQAPTSFKVFRNGAEIPLEELPVQLAAQGQVIENYEEDIVFPDGTVRHWFGNATPFLNEAKQPTGAVAAFIDITERKRAEAALARGARQKDALYQLADRLNRTKSLADVYDAALQAIASALRCDRASILLLDDAGVMRFVGWRELSDTYRTATEGHSPWTREDSNPQPICIDDVATAAIAGPLRATIEAEGIRALAFIPLMSDGRLIGKFMTYCNAPHVFSHDELELGLTIARQLAFGIERKQADDALRSRTAQYETLLNQAPVGVYLVDADFLIREVNPLALPVFGDIPGGVIGRDFEEIIHILWNKDYADELVRIFRRTLETGEPYITPQCAEFRADRGLIEYYEWRLDRITLPDGRHGLVCYFRDISRRFQARAAAVRRSEQVRRLADIATRLNAASDVASVTSVVTEEARRLIESHLSVISLPLDQGWGHVITNVSLSEKYAAWRTYDAKPDGSGIYSMVCRSNKPMRMTQAELKSHAEWKGFGGEAGKHPPLRGWLAAPLIGRDGRNIGVIQVSDKYEGEFTADDEAILVQLAQMASVAVENARLVEDLREADRRKDEFLAMLAHELRNPLAPIANAVHLLRRDKTEDTIQQQARAIIERQTGRLTRLVDDLLEVSRITSGRIQLHMERIAIGGILERAAETVRPLIEQHRHTLHVSLPQEPLWLYGDAARLEQVLVNLLNNAAKYTDDGGRIELTVRPEDQHAVLRVLDTGVGIEPELLPRVFDLFTQAERSLDRSHGGLGIGLSLVHRLVSMHGGTVEAKSAVGQGSEFIVRLPALQAPAAGVAADAADAGHAAARPLRVLVVDDNIDAAQSLAMLLETSGHVVWMAHDGLAALEAAGEYRPHIAFLDIGLPRLDGYEVARRLRRDSALGGIRLIAVTGYGQASDRERSRQAGFDQHLVKPADFSILERILAEVASKAPGQGEPESAR